MTFTHTVCHLIWLFHLSFFFFFSYWFKTGSTDQSLCPHYWFHVNYGKHFITLEQQVCPLWNFILEEKCFFFFFYCIWIKRCWVPVLMQINRSSYRRCCSGSLSPDCGPDVVTGGGQSCLFRDCRTSRTQAKLILSYCLCFCWGHAAKFKSTHSNTQAAKSWPQLLSLWWSGDYLIGWVYSWDWFKIMFFVFF